MKAHLRKAAEHTVERAWPSSSSSRASTIRAGRHSSLGYLSPIRFERQFAEVTLQPGTCRPGRKGALGRTKRLPKKGGQNAVTPDTLIPRPHLSTKPGQVHNTQTAYDRRRVHPSPPAERDRLPSTCWITSADPRKRRSAVKMRLGMTRARSRAYAP
jgi:hypothetical protein